MYQHPKTVCSIQATNIGNFFSFGTDLLCHGSSKFQCNFLSSMFINVIFLGGCFFLIKHTTWILEDGYNVKQKSIDPGWILDAQSLQLVQIEKLIFVILNPFRNTISININWKTIQIQHQENINCISSLPNRTRQLKMVDDCWIQSLLLWGVICQRISKCLEDCKV